MTDQQRRVMLTIINNPGKKPCEIARLCSASYACVYHNMKVLMPEGKQK